MTPRADLPRLSDLPIPADVTVGRAWPPQMQEMADYIGAYDTLRVSELLGGQFIYIPHDPDRSPFRALLTRDKVETIARIYGGSRYMVTTAARELRAARRGAVVAAVRARQMTVGDAAMICETSRNYMSHLVNRTDEGRGAAVPAILPRRAQADPRQIDLFGE